MAHIVELTISGLVGRKDVYKAKLDRNINVFFGLNGSGKTSLLKILHCAMGGDTAMLETVPFDRAEVVIHSLDYDKDFAVTIRKSRRKSQVAAKMRKVKKPPKMKAGDTKDTILGETGQRRQEFSLTYEPKLPSGAGRTWAHGYLPTWRLYMGAEWDSWFSPYDYAVVGERRGEVEWDKVFAMNLERLWSNYSTRLLSEVREIQGKGLADILTGILARPGAPKQPRRLGSETTYHRVRSFLARQGSPDALGSPEEFKNRLKTDDAFKRVVGDLNRVEQQIHKTLGSRNELEQLIRHMFTGNKTVVFEDTGIRVETDEKEQIGLASLSSGEKHTLRLFIATLLTGSSTLLVDEPEISLHIDWQRRLISAIQQLSSPTQLILATHSPEIMGGMDDRNIFRL